MPGADSAAVFIVIPVDTVMTTVLDAPVPAVILQHVGGVGLAGRFASHPIGELLVLLAAFFVDGDAFHPEDLSEVGKVEIVIESGGDPDISDFDAAMLGAIEGRVIGLAVERVKIERGLFKPLFLIAFDGEVVVRAPILNPIAGQFALGQQGIGGDGFALDVDGLQQRDSGFDFVGLFFLVATG